MGTPFDLTIQTVSSAFGTNATIPLAGAATVNGVSYLTFTLAGASTASAGTTVDYSILDTAASEIGTATYISSANTLTSRTPTKSTNGNAAITASSAALILGTIRAESLTPFIVAGQLLGTATNDSANAGNVGEVISATVTSSTLVSASVANITSVTLTAGDWDLFGPFFGSGSGTPAVTNINVTIFTSNATIVNTQGQTYAFRGTTLTDPLLGATVGPFRVSTAVSTTYYLNTSVTYSTATGASFAVTGLLRARRVR